WSLRGRPPGEPGGPAPVLLKPTSPALRRGHRNDPDFPSAPLRGPDIVSYGSPAGHTGVGEIPLPPVRSVGGSCVDGHSAGLAVGIHRDEDGQGRRGFDRYGQGA